MDGRTSAALNRKKQRKRLIKVLMRLGLFVLVFCAIWRYTAQGLIISAYNNEMDSYRAQIDDAHKLAEQLESTKQLCGTDDFIEQLAREKFGMARYNERIFVVISNE